MQPFFRATVLVLILPPLIGLAACQQPEINPIQGRLCRIAAVAVFDPAALEIDAQAMLPPEAGLPGTGLPGGVRIDLHEAASGRGHWIDCRFTPATPDSEPQLADVATESGSLSQPRLFALQRFWLDSLDAVGTDPLVSEDAQRLPVLPLWLAYGLQQALNALPNAAIYGLLAAAYSLIYGLSGRINLAIGELAATGSAAAFLAAALLPAAPGPMRLVAALLFGLWAAALHGMAMEKLVLWPLRRSSGQQGLVATIGIALFLQEYLRLVQGSTVKWITSILSDPIELARAGAFTLTVTPLALILAGTAAVASAAVLAGLRFSRFGRDWRATADDPLAAALFGVDPQALSLKTFALACGLVGLAGASVIVFYGSLGLLYTTALGLKALIAAIIGGIGSVPGAFLGGIGIALLEGLWSAYFPIVYRDFVIDIALVAMLVLRPGGLFGYRDLLPRRV